MILERWQRRLRKLRKHPRPLRLIASRALWHGGVSHLFTIELPHGLKLRFHPSSISAALWVEGEARNEDVMFLENVLRAGDRYVDVGANIGHLAIVARHCVGETGSVIALEANPRIHGYCASNLALNGFHDVVSMNVALGERSGSTLISDRRDDDQNRLGDTGVTVPMRPLDHVVSLDAITLLKIDVEGYELPVLRGAARTLSRTTFVYCELSTSNSARFGYEPRTAERLLLDSGFLLAQQRGPDLFVTSQPLFEHLDASARPRTGYNVVAVRREAIDELATRLAERGHRLVIQSA